MHYDPLRLGPRTTDLSERTSLPPPTTPRHTHCKPPPTSRHPSIPSRHPRSKTHLPAHNIRVTHRSPRPHAALLSAIPREPTSSLCVPPAVPSAARTRTQGPEHPGPPSPWTTRLTQPTNLAARLSAHSAVVGPSANLPPGLQVPAQQQLLDTHLGLLL